ncbi:MAG: hypothetical protein P4L62_02350 [Candidatus Pacebacteria bacterium]|nr:hypothetical protein [Candidatus Paceibacterota bacterium]
MTEAVSLTEAVLVSNKAIFRVRSLPFCAVSTFALSMIQLKGSASVKDCIFLSFIEMFEDMIETISFLVSKSPFMNNLLALFMKSEACSIFSKTLQKLSMELRRISPSVASSLRSSANFLL